MKQPVCIVAISSIIGIIMGLYCKGIASFILFFLGFSISIFVYLAIKKKARFLKQAILLSLSVIGIFMFYTQQLEKEYEKIYNQYDNQELMIEAKVTSNPEEKEYKDVYTIKVTKINGKKIKPINLLLQVKKEKTTLEYGDIISFTATYEKPEVARNTMGFNYSSYLKVKKIAGTVSCKLSEITVINSKEYSKNAKNKMLGQEKAKDENITKVNSFSVGKILEEIKSSIQAKLNQLLPRDLARVSSRTYYRRKRANRGNNNSRLQT